MYASAGSAHSQQAVSHTCKHAACPGIAHGPALRSASAVAVAIVLFRSLEVSRVRNPNPKQLAPLCTGLPLTFTSHCTPALQASLKPSPKSLQDFYDAPLTWSVLPLICARFLAIGIGSLLVGEQRDSFEKQSLQQAEGAHTVPQQNFAFLPCAQLTGGVASPWWEPAGVGVALACAFILKRFQLSPSSNSSDGTLAFNGGLEFAYCAILQAWPSTSCLSCAAAE